jgi:hypothetical protein
VIQVGAAFGHEASFVEAGRRRGLGRWGFYFGARAGVLGTVDADVVTAACGFFAAGLVRPAWDAPLAAASPDDLVREDVTLCIAWARRHLAGLPGLERLADLATQVVDGADATGRVLFAAWRALPDPRRRSGRSRRPGAAAAAGAPRSRAPAGRRGRRLTPLGAILAGQGPAKAAANGWQPPYPVVTEHDTQRLDAAERRTDALAGTAYQVLDARERAELAELLQSAHRHVTRLNNPPAPTTIAKLAPESRSQELRRTS